MDRRAASVQWGCRSWVPCVPWPCGVCSVRLAGFQFASHLTNFEESAWHGVGTLARSTLTAPLLTQHRLHAQPACIFGSKASLPSCTLAVLVLLGWVELGCTQVSSDEGCWGVHCHPSAAHRGPQTPLTLPLLFSRDVMGDRPNCHPCGGPRGSTATSRQPPASC